MTRHLLKPKVSRETGETFFLLEASSFSSVIAGHRHPGGCENDACENYLLSSPEVFKLLHKVFCASKASCSIFRAVSSFISRVRSLGASRINGVEEGESCR